MNKAELINEIAARSVTRHSPGVSKVVVTAVLETLAEVVHKQLVGPGSEIIVPGLGKFTVKSRGARPGRHPATGAEIEIPAKNVPHFSAGAALKHAVE
jgi:DNA-binding protein HU-beta